VPMMKVRHQLIILKYSINITNREVLSMLRFFL